ncbi:unnamed protein product [Parajaminaea phylloscopi]
MANLLCFLLAAVLGTGLAHADQCGGYGASGCPGDATGIGNLPITSYGNYKWVKCDVAVNVYATTSCDGNRIGRYNAGQCFDDTGAGCLKQSDT